MEALCVNVENLQHRMITEQRSFLIIIIPVMTPFIAGGGVAAFCQSHSLLSCKCQRSEMQVSRAHE